MAWIRDGELPDKIKVSFVVSAEEHPELAKFILSLPFRGTSKILREILSSAVKNAGAQQVVMNSSANQDGDDVARGGNAGSPTQGESPRADSVRQPGVEEVSAAAANIIENFDRMFPS